MRYDSMCRSALVRAWDIWRCGRAAECTGLENRRWETIRGFKSLHLRRSTAHSGVSGVGGFGFGVRLGLRVGAVRLGAHVLRPKPARDS